jgi:hypothetical protein
MPPEFAPELPPGELTERFPKRFEWRRALDSKNDEDVFVISEKVRRLASLLLVSPSPQILDSSTLLTRTPHAFTLAPYLPLRRGN